MKKLKFLAICLFSSFLFAQEVQLHYDYLENRKYLTGTFEVFKPDSLGNTFFFTDFDFGRNDGASLAYFEIARKFNIPNKLIKGLNAHIEYNDGFFISNDQATKNTGLISGIPFNRSVLAGFGLPVKIGGVTIQTSYLYKNIKNSHGIDWQFTAFVFKNIFKDKITIRGFVDLWTEDILGGKEKYLVLLSEPQILYNINKSFSVGSEIEISSNFVEKKWKVYPTAMIRWNL